MEKVQCVEGSYEFLIGAGFEEQLLDDEKYLIFSQSEIDHFPELLEGLKNAEKIQLELDRNIQVLLSSQARKFELPQDFFRVSKEEIKREQNMR